MDFRVTEDQQALQEGIRSFCTGRIALEQIAERVSDGLDRELWQELAEMGVFSLRLAESDGGVGLGSAEAVLVFEELGRALAPGPLAWTHLAAGLVKGAADGTRIVGGLDLCDAAGPPFVIEHLDAIDDLLLLRPDRVDRVDPAAVKAEPTTPLDPLTPVWQANTLPAGERVAGAQAAARMRLEGACLGAAQLLGIAEATLELANEYAKGREQFDRTIGSFQSIKHLLADSFVRQEVARAAVYAAGATLDDPAVGDVDRAASVAKLCAGEAAWKNARTCIQVHGGMGYTWEVPAHFFLKRAWVLETTFGDAEEHADAVSGHVAAAAAD